MSDRLAEDPFLKKKFQLQVLWYFGSSRTRWSLSHWGASFFSERNRFPLLFLSPENNFLIYSLLILFFFFYSKGLFSSTRTFACSSCLQGHLGLHAPSKWIRFTSQESTQYYTDMSWPKVLKGLTFMVTSSGRAF